MAGSILKMKLQVFCGGEPAVGPGKAALLEAVDREGSISAASRAMGMSYRKAWLLVDSMNRCWCDRIVSTSAGGAQLTTLGREVLAAFRALETQLMQAADGPALQALEERLLSSPRPPLVPIPDGSAA